MKFEKRDIADMVQYMCKLGLDLVQFVYIAPTSLQLGALDLFNLSSRYLVEYIVLILCMYVCDMSTIVTIPTSKCYFRLLCFLKI